MTEQTDSPERKTSGNASLNSDDNRHTEKRTEVHTEEHKEARKGERVADFIKATTRLAEACEQPENTFIRDSVIQRFEFCWELAWKALRLQLLEVGISANNPRDVFRESLSAGFIHDGNLWTEAQRMRNLTTHTYDEALAKSVYDFIRQTALDLFRQLAARLS